MEKKRSTFVAGVLDMTLEGLLEIFKGYYADTCARKIPIVLMGAERRIPQIRERGQVMLDWVKAVTGKDSEHTVLWGVCICQVRLGRQVHSANYCVPPSTIR